MTPSSEQLEATRRIKNLKNEYFRAIDAKDWEAFAPLFTADCEFITYKDAANTQPKRRCGPEEITASVLKTTADARTKHRADLAEISFPAADEAEALWDLTDEAALADGRTFRGAGRYHERYRRIGDTWLISRLELKRSWIKIE